MKKVVLLFLSCICVASLIAQKKFLIAGSGSKNVAMVNSKDNKVVWKHALQPGEDCNDIEMTKSGDILIACLSTARLVSPDQKTIWTYSVPKGEEVNTATQLPDGSFFLAICATPARFVKLDKNGKEVSVQTFNTGIGKAHGQFRQVLLTDKGTYIIPLMSKGEVVEIDKNSKVLKRVTVGGSPFSVKIMKNGNWLVSCGDGHKLAIVDPVKQAVVKSITSEDLKDVSILFAAEAIELKNGNILFTNWSGHASDKDQPNMVELNAKNQVVRSYSFDKNVIKNVSAVAFCQ